MGTVVTGAGQGAESEREGQVYRVFSHHGTLEKVETGAGKKECRYLESALDAEHTYSQLYQTFLSSPHSLSPSLLTSSSSSSSVGSPLLQKVWT